MADRIFEKFIQKNGPRKGQSYTIKRGPSGSLQRVYENGDTAYAQKPAMGLGGRVPMPAPKKKRKVPRGLGGRLDY